MVQFYLLYSVQLAIIGVIVTTKKEVALGNKWVLYRFCLQIIHVSLKDFLHQLQNGICSSWGCGCAWVVALEHKKDLISVCFISISRGWAGKKPSICANTGYPAFVFGLPVIKAYRLKLSRKWAGRIFSCAFLFRKWKWFPEINSENYKFSGFFPARYPVPAQPEPEFEIREQDIPFRHKYLVPVPLNP